jgi:3-oxoacyl-[acyl-carrier protein] reductase
MTDQQRTAIVTGASRGIGRATALRLADDFDHLVLVARNEAALAECRSKIEESDTKALILAKDLRSSESAEEIIAATIAATGRVDALVNVAGAVPQGDLLSLTDEEWHDGLSMKFHGARRLALAAWPYLKESRGSLVFISGATAVTPSAALAAVSTINAAISALAKAFADQGLSDGVRVNSVLPGAVMTGRRLAMLTRYAVARGLSLEDGIEHYAKEAGIGRLGNPEEIAELIAFAVSPASRWMTGTSLRIDGGETRAI